MKFFRDLKSVLNLTVIVAGLGYFVDLFDITVFGVVRTASLNSLGITDPAEVFSAGLLIYNSQMVGMMAGGIVWGIIADRRGRLAGMFGSILLYSLANFANMFVWDANSYALVRFIGGFGLAGELGAAVTLVAESLPIEKRGLGTTVVATLGILGILAAAMVGQILPWKMTYLVGGLMGLALLATRFKLSESKIFAKAHSTVARGNLLLLIKGRNFPKYLCCILVGVPLYFTTGVIFTFAPELTAGLDVVGVVTAGSAIAYGSIGLALGDLLCGILSFKLKSRKKAISISILFGVMLVFALISLRGLSSTVIYLFMLAIGVCVGYWAVLITVAAEQFGTNIRATAATTIPNFVRGSAILAVSSFASLKNILSVQQAALIVAAACFSIALIALSQLDETFHRDLDYNES